MRNKGFTLVEMLIVVAIVIMLSTGVLFSSFVMRDQLEFRKGYNSLEGILSEARNMALSGESFEDTSDYDGDGLIGEDDHILPNGYIVVLSDEGVNVTAYLYADLFDSNVDQYDASDQLIKMVEIPENIHLEVDARSKSGNVIGEFPRDSITFMYKTPDAAFSVIDTNITSLQIMSLQLKIAQTEEDDVSAIKRSKYIFLHYLYGIPELLNESFFEETS